MSLICGRVLGRKLVCGRRFLSNEYCPPNFNRHPKCASCKRDYCPNCVIELGIQKTCPCCRDWIGFPCQVPWCVPMVPRSCLSCKEDLCNKSKCSSFQSQLGGFLCTRCEEEQRPKESDEFDVFQDVVGFDAQCYNCKATQPLVRCADIQCVQVFCLSSSCSDAEYKCKRCCIDKTIKIPESLTSTVLIGTPAPKTLLLPKYRLQPQQVKTQQGPANQKKVGSVSQRRFRRREKRDKTVVFGERVRKGQLVYRPKK